ncbi:CpsD/CapB family tyrosine-protein kinase [Paracoccus sp. 1_MG-2023]|uniref:CpsD/CapB family tyrosine-protein kinase n=1 Tax=unclassified Paracoccus (in: a-proteobacteria) TaxID=2688777 RepID=UPI001C0A035C|nr:MULTISPECIES: CpsD/CapB family tyrosine-protein kinase [unclassified Paracoccus (in: a-proteobacteria)]MBU2958947.1 CpsD/CapB family tyrosine-protein kinase [Paracoccus sp. C2R09]MDO6669963.1 CpsD/CapB family tyrosine-protein kinase [Paracoccus sp. 1_MG-2023]
MEKLQAAIEIARRKRASQDGAADLRPAASAHVETPDPDQRAPAADPWPDLAEVELDRGALIRSRILSQNASMESTPFDVLRTKILYQMRQNGWRRLAITSPMPQCGKSTTSVNLALALSRQPELRTILFDFDLRSPTVAQKLGLKDAPSITPLLRGETEFADQAVRVGPNLALALSGVPDSDPTRLLMSDSTREALARVQTTYDPDIMIFDLPSILIGDDARAFLQHVDCALILARADQTRYGDFDSCEREVGEYTNVLGVVLNGYRRSDGKFDAIEGDG